MLTSQIDLQNADCFDYLKTIADFSINHVVIDPPYGVLTGHKIETEIDKDLLFSELWRVLPETGFCVFFGQFPTLTAWCIAAEKAGFRFSDHIVWAKRTITSPYLPIQRSHEEILIFKKGQPKYVETMERYEDLKTPAMWMGLYELSTYHVTINDLQHRLNDNAYNMLYYNGLKQKGYQDPNTNDNIFDKSGSQPRQGVRPNIDLERFMLENNLKMLRTNKAPQNQNDGYYAGKLNDPNLDSKHIQNAGFRYRSKHYCNVTNIWAFCDYSNPRPKGELKVKKAYFAPNGISTVWSYLPENQTKFGANGINHKHPTVKSLKLMERLIKLVSKEGDTILDCFSGSGSTAVACLRLKRNFKGCEKDEKYWRDSIARLEQEQRLLNAPPKVKKTAKQQPINDTKQTTLF